MCGIAGSVALRDGLPPPRVEDALAMIGALAHRGPDEFGVYRDRRAALAHARLSIIDVATGQQPLSNEDGTLWIAFNGEIFNYVELRAELVQLGHAFRTLSDTEVIVHAYEAWGDDAFARFNGQFAVALWDSARSRLVLARDRLGVRPLYVCEHAGRLLFASEVKALFAADPTIPRTLDPGGLAQTFTFWTVVAPRTVFEAVRELEPGHVRTITPEGTRERTFWAPRFPTAAAEVFGGSLEEAVARVRDALESAVRLRMLRSDVPVASYLSGGLDSSLVAALGRAARGGRFLTFSVRFEDAEYDETPFQQEVAARLGSEHHALLVRRADIADAFPAVVRHAERPLLRTAPAPLFLLSRLVRGAGVKVVLTGEGADELFGGYDLFREAKVRRFWGRRPESTLRPLLLRRLYPYLSRSPVSEEGFARAFFGAERARGDAPGFSHLPRWRSTAALFRLFAPWLRERLSGVDVTAELLASLPPEHGRWADLARDQYLEIRTLLSGYLLSAQGDRMLMAHSVEGRFPFLDAEVVELANALPPSYKLRVLDEKHVLKRLAEELVPPSVVRRKKQPYRAPDAACFLGPVRAPWIDEVLSDGALADAGVFDPRAVRQLWQKCQARGGDGPLSNSDNMALVGVLSTQLVHRDLVRAAPPGAPERLQLRTFVDRAGPDAPRGRGPAEVGRPGR